MNQEAKKTGRKLERQVADAYRRLGARKVEHDEEMAGNQIDVYVELETPGCLLHRVAVEVKDWSRSVGKDVVNKFATIAGLLRTRGMIDEGVIVSASGFSKQARNAAAEHSVRLLEPADLETMVARPQDGRGARPAVPVSQPQGETTQATNSAQAEAPSKPQVAQSLDVRILQILYDYRQAHPGDHKINLNELIESSGAERKAVISCILELQEKRWLEYNLTEGGESGLVWLTRLGTRVAGDSYSREHGSDGSVEMTQAGNKGVEGGGKTPASTRIDQTVPVSYEPFQEPAESLVELPPKFPSTVLIPAGPFLMGSPSDDLQAYKNEKPLRKVDLQEYRIGRYPVTNAQYICFVLSTGHTAPDHWDAENIPSDLEDHPVVNVSYEDADAYCRWLSRVTGQPYRLPSEEEWEKAARGGFPHTRCYPWGGEWQVGICNTRELGRNGTSSVYECEDVNCSPFEVVNMVGNVWEWTESWYERYPGSSHEGVHYGRSRRVVRGGSWRNSQQEARISCRGRYKPDVRRLYLGFRVASDASEGEASEYVDLVDLHRLITSCFDKEDLRQLCFDLGIDYDDLRGEGKTNKVRELVMYFRRRGCIHDLVEYCRRTRPDVCTID